MIDFSQELRKCLCKLGKTVVITNRPKLEKLWEAAAKATFETRLLDCLFTLHVHGVITDTELLEAGYRLKAVLEKRKKADEKGVNDDERQ